jgi:hypothetical protein
MDRIMNHDEIAELLGAYALDAVDADEGSSHRGPSERVSPLYGGTGPAPRGGRSSGQCRERRLGGTVGSDRRPSRPPRRASAGRDGARRRAGRCPPPPDLEPAPPGPVVLHRRHRRHRRRRHRLAGGPGRSPRRPRQPDWCNRLALGRTAEPPGPPGGSHEPHGGDGPWPTSSSCRRDRLCDQPPAPPCRRTRPISCGARSRAGPSRSGCSAIGPRRSRSPWPTAPSSPPTPSPLRTPPAGRWPRHGPRWRKVRPDGRLSGRSPYRRLTASAPDSARTSPGYAPPVLAEASWKESGRASQ